LLAGHATNVPTSAGRTQRADPLQRISEPVFLDLQVIPGLQVDPEPLRGAEEPGQPQRRVRADAALAVHDLVDPPGRDPDLLARWYWLIASGLRNSSSRISPGCTGAMTVSAAMLSPLSSGRLHPRRRQPGRRPRTPGMPGPGPAARVTQRHNTHSGAARNAPPIHESPSITAARRALSLTVTVTYSSGIPDRWVLCRLAGLGFDVGRGARPCRE